MKYVNMLGLASIAAIALTAFVASSASATSLWSGAAKLPAGTEIAASLSSSAQWTEEGGEEKVLDKCTESSISGKTAQESAAEITSAGEVKVTWGGCTFTTSTIKGGTLGITWTAGQNGTFKLKSTEVTVLAFGLFTCIYGTPANPGVFGTLDGSTTGSAIFTANVKMEFKSGSFLCSRTVVYRANYTVLGPLPLHVTP